MQNDGIDLSSSEQITGMSLASRIISSPTLEIFAAECIFDNNGRQTGYDFNNAIVFFSHKESDSHSYPKGSSDRSSGSLETRASAGDSDAQYQLAELYLEGKGVPQNDVKAAELFGKAAAQGNALAQFRFGWMFEDKRGVPQNYVKAAEWYEKAALQGVAVAQSNLAGMYFSGRGVPQNDKKAFAWYKKAAEQGQDEPEGQRVADASGNPAGRVRLPARRPLGAGVGRPVQGGSSRGLVEPADEGARREQADDPEEERCGDRDQPEEAAPEWCS